MSLETIYNLPKIAEETALSSVEFLSKYGRPNKPFILRGGIEKNQAFKDWGWDYFRERFGEQKVIVYRTGNRSEYYQTAFKDYIDYCLTTNDDKPYYLLDWFLEANCPSMRDEFSVPGFFNSWTEQFPDKLRPKFLSFYIGPKNSASPLHIDILTTSAWNAVFRGQKLWVFYPPTQTKYLYHGKVNPFDLDLEQYPLFAKAQGYACIHEEGDLIFTPSGWWHAVYNTENCISLTDNFINRSNFPIFIRRFFPAMRHLIKRTWVRRKQVYNR